MGCVAALRCTVSRARRNHLYVRCFDGQKQMEKSAEPEVPLLMLMPPPPDHARDSLPEWIFDSKQAAGSLDELPPPLVFALAVEAWNSYAAAAAAATASISTPATTTAAADVSTQNITLPSSKTVAVATNTVIAACDSQSKQPLTTAPAVPVVTVHHNPKGSGEIGTSIWPSSYRNGFNKIASR